MSKKYVLRRLADGQYGMMIGTTKHISEAKTYDYEVNPDVGWERIEITPVSDMKSMELTDEEIKLIEALRKEKKDKPFRVGTLREDLYLFVAKENYSGLYSDTELNMFVASNFKKILEEGTRFVCFKDEHGKEQWYDDIGYGIERMDCVWAGDYLENIKDI